ncbi:hypothetical protein Lalb_Chr17g0348111 [Lupinus albus]|uniref:Uncharacterized protein n=1 Tax=Lupinus albus TaxID=3870 RepID=A0A6A4P181_LUPAL|nr:hypothetical protein Lalb_Chr17g0348111 [Lupinus albus]
MVVFSCINEFDLLMFVIGNDLFATEFHRIHIENDDDDDDDDDRIDIAPAA